MNLNTFKNLSKEETSFLEELSDLSTTKKRKKDLLYKHSSTDAKISYIYKQRVYLDQDERQIMNVAMDSDQSRIKNYFTLYSGTFVVSFLGLVNQFEFD